MRKSRTLNIRSKSHASLSLNLEKIPPREEKDKSPRSPKELWKSISSPSGNKLHRSTSGGHSRFSLFKSNTPPSSPPPSPSSSEQLKELQHRVLEEAALRQKAETELNELKAKYAELQEQNKQLSSRCATLENHHADSVDDRMKSMIKEVHTKYHQLKDENVLLKRLNSELAARVEQLNKKLKQLQS